MSELLLAFYLQIPIIVGGVLHMVAVTHDWCPRLRIPLHERSFGANKTLRGFLLMPLFTTLGMAALHLLEQAGAVQLLPPGNVLLAGIAVGLGYVVAELPNSFLKRRLGIAAGELPERHRRLFVFLDQFDSGFGVALAYWLYPGAPFTVCLLFVLTFPGTALLVKRLLFWARLKKTAV